MLLYFICVVFSSGFLVIYILMHVFIGDRKGEIVVFSPPPFNSFHSSYFCVCFFVSIFVFFIIYSSRKVQRYVNQYNRLSNFIVIMAYRY